MNDIITFPGSNKQTGAGTLDSRDVAKMVGKLHGNLVRDIETYSKYMEESSEIKIDSADFFIEDTYVDEQGKPRKCFLITKKGCEMISNKLTGARGVQFTAMYVAKFNEMEQALPSVDATQLSPQLQALINIELRQSKMEKQLVAATAKVEAVESTITTIKDTIIQRDDDWRASINKMFDNAVISSGTNDYQAMRHSSYEMLEQRAHCNLNLRLRNMRDRLAERGATKTQINRVTKMDVIEEAPALKEIYTSIVKELSIRYTPPAQTSWM